VVHIVVKQDAVLKPKKMKKNPFRKIDTRANKQLSNIFNTSEKDMESQSKHRVTYNNGDEVMYYNFDTETLIDMLEQETTDDIYVTNIKEVQE
jgi:hypothetical protein